MPDEPLQLLIAEDQRMFRDGLRAMLSDAPDLEIVAEADTGVQAIQLAQELQPDVVLMDVYFDPDPSVDGVEATRQIVLHSPNIRVLIVTIDRDPDTVFAAVRAGALGYVLKTATGEELIRAIRTVAAGSAVWDQPIAERLRDAVLQAQVARPDAFPELATRERAVLELMAAGKHYRQIGRELGISEKTVRNYASNIFGKLHVSDRVAAIDQARKAGLGTGTRRPP
jgi:DNA-binding NarL/FixJ family response regulator